MYFVIDKTAHSSIQINRGLLAQFGQIIMVDCKDHQWIEDACKNNQLKGYTSIIITDGIGSMGGMVSVKFLLNLAEKYNSYVYLDDAHGSSVHGYHGAGYALKCLEYQFPSVITLLQFSFKKLLKSKRLNTALWVASLNLVLYGYKNRFAFYHTRCPFAY